MPLGDNVAVPDQHRAWGVLERWDKPFRCCFSDRDPITRGGQNLFIERVPGARDQTHGLLKGGHFIQEDDPDGFVAHVLDVAANLDAKNRSRGRFDGAGEAIRTPDPNLGKVVLYP